MRIFLEQLGCRLNYSENDTLASRLRAAGHQVVGQPEAAHVIVLNTCAVTAQAARKSRQLSRKLHRSNPQARLALTGCYATLAPEAAGNLPGVALVADNQQKEMLHALIEPWSADFEDPLDLERIQPDGVPLFDPTPHDDAARGRTRAFIKVQDGCNNRCTFCIVTIARGAARSRPLNDIVDEVRSLAANGYCEVVLTGVHLGAYGRDREGDAASNLKELTRTLLKETEIPRLRLSSLEPWEMADGFFSLWEEYPHRLCPHLHLPLQAGTDQQLRRMARRCTTDSFRALVNEARAAIPDLVLTTDLIAGFPGESDADFEAGLAFVEEMEFAHAHIFPFSARSGTAAADFADQLPRAVKKERVKRLHEAVALSGQRVRRRFVGSTRPVLWEGEGRPLDDESGDWLWSGLTDNYLRVLCQAPAGLDLSGRIEDVRIDHLEGENLIGERTRIRRDARERTFVNTKT